MSAPPPRRPAARRRAVVVPAALAALLLAGCGEHAVLGPDGPAARSIARLGWFMLIAAFVIGGGYLLGLGYALWRGGRRPATPPGEGGRPAHGERDERSERGLVVAGGVVLPVLVIAALTTLSLNILNDRPPPDALSLHVIGHRYWWEVRYPAAGATPGFTTANEFVIPVGRPVAITLDSADVQHSFWLPDLAGKMDLYPGRTNQLVIQADHTGRYRGQCAELCGVQHANMAFTVQAVPPDEFAAYLTHHAALAAPPDTDAERAGQAAFLSRPCAGCHTIRGTAAAGELGPDLTHLASRRTIGAGVAPNDRGHLGGWVANSQTMKPGNEMPPVPLTPQQLQDLLVYLESLE
ncbi:MAG: cytochrome c oxidase subunit II [Acidimicrobiia bacterium]